MHKRGVWAGGKETVLDLECSDNGTETTQKGSEMELFVAQMKHLEGRGAEMRTFGGARTRARSGFLSPHKYAARPRHACGLPHGYAVPCGVPSEAPNVYAVRVRCAQ